MNSCKKDIEKITDDNYNPYSNARLFEEESDEEIEGFIVGFISDLEDPENADDLSLEETVWFVEAAINYQYAFTDSLYETALSDSVVYTISITDEVINFQDVADFYDEMFEEVQDFYDEIDDNTKHLIIVDVSIKETREDEVDLIFVSRFGYGTNQATGEDYSSSDYWLHDAGRGKCGGFSGGSGIDAAKLINNSVNFETTISYSAGVYCHYIDIQGNIYFPDDVFNPLLNPNDITPNDNLCDYLLFFSVSCNPNHHDCLCPAEMNFYHTAAIDVINQEKPSGLYKIYFNLVGTTWGTSPQIYEHVATIEYGVPVTSHTAPTSL